MAKILNKNFEDSKLSQSKITGEEVNMPEILLGYFIGPFGAVLSSGIFTSILQNYFTDVLRLNLGFLTGLQLMSTIFIIAANLIVGQLIERTKCMAGKARPWILLSAFTISVSSVLMFVVPFQGTMKYIWIAVAYNLCWFRYQQGTARKGEHLQLLEILQALAQWELVLWHFQCLCLFH